MEGRSNSDYSILIMADVVVADMVCGRYGTERLAH